MICTDPDFLEKVREAAEINRLAGAWVAPSPFESFHNRLLGIGEVDPEASEPKDQTH